MSVLLPDIANAAQPLAALVSLMRPRAVQAKVITGAGQWSIRKPRYADPAFCLVVDGSCFLDLEGIGPVELRAGDFLLLPQTPGFVLASEPGLEPTPSAFDYERNTRHGRADGHPTMRMLGGYFRFPADNAGLLTSLLPPAVIVGAQEPAAGRLRSIVELIGDEVNAERPSRDLVLEQLVELLIVEALRLRLDPAGPTERGMFAGLADPLLGNVIRAIHERVEFGWTVERLARVSGMSRAAFSERFTRTVGMPPKQYVTQWRIARAKELLRGDRPSLQDIAVSVGYQSASAFTTAFSRATGCSPTEFSRTMR